MSSRPKNVRPGRGAAEAALMDLGAALHAAGAPAHRVEAALADVARAWGVAGEFLVTPTALQAAFGGREGQRHALLRVEPGEVALARLDAVEGAVREAAAGRMGPAAVERALAGLEARPWGSAAEALAATALGGAAAVFFGGGEGHVLAGAVASVAVYATSVAVGRSGARRLVALAGAGVGTATAIVGARWLGLPTAWPAVLGGVIGLAPGFALTTAATEIAAGHLVSGSARLVAAASTFLQLTLAIAAVGGGLGAWSSGELALAGPAHGAAPWIAATVAGLCYTVLLGARARDAGLMLAGAVGGYAAYVVADTTLGGWWAPFVAAAAVSAASEAWARWTGRPAALPLVPGLLTLVPGGSGLGSLSLLLRDDVSGVGAALGTGMAAVALASGVLVGAQLTAIPGGRPRAARAG